MSHSKKTHLKLLAPFLWPSEEILEVVEITTDPGVARRTGVLSVTSQRVLVMVELRSGGGLKTTLRTYSFRHRNLQVEVTDDGALALQSKEQVLTAFVTEQPDDPAAAVTERVAALIAEQRAL